MVGAFYSLSTHKIDGEVTAHTVSMKGNIRFLELVTAAPKGCLGNGLQWRNLGNWIHLDLAVGRPEANRLLIK